MVRYKPKVAVTVLTTVMPTVQVAPVTAVQLLLKN